MSRRRRNNGPWSAATWGGSLGALLGAGFGLLLGVLSGTRSIAVQPVAVLGLYWGVIGVCAGLQAWLSIAERLELGVEHGPAVGGGALGAVIGGLLITWVFAFVYAVGALLHLWGESDVPLAALFVSPVCWVPLYLGFGALIGLFVSVQARR